MKPTICNGRIKTAGIIVLILCLLMVVLCACVNNPDSGEYMLPYAVHLSVSDDPASTRDVAWILNEGYALSYLEYYGNGAKADVKRLQAETEVIFRNKVLCTVHLEGLDPKTEYKYRVGGGDYWTDEYAFTTAGGGDFTFLYLGDTQKELDSEDGYDLFSKNIKHAFEHGEAELMLIGGDLINNGDNFSEWMEFFTAADGVPANLTLMPAMGNHDNTDGYKEMFVLPQNGPENSKEHFYSFDYNDAHFTVLDSNTVFREENIEWLKNDLEATDKRWKIVMLHHPIYPANNASRDVTRAENLQREIAPILEKNGVDLVLMGHQHVFYRSHPLSEGKIVPSGGIVYLMGLAGNKFYVATPAEHMAFYKEYTALHTYISVTEGYMELNSYGHGGELMDTYRINK